MTPRLATTLFALAALASAQTAQAQQQQSCVKAGDLSDAVVYALPIAFDAVRTTCANRLTRSGFVASRGEAYVAQFRGRQAQAWPGALRVLKSFMTGPDAGEAAAGADIGAMIAGMPDSALRPFVDALVGQMIADEIKPDSCGRIERGLEVISPMPAENVGPLVAFIFEVSDMKNPEICPAASASTSRR